MTATLDVYIGFDSKEVAAYHVLCQSILERSSIPVRFMPLNLNNMKGTFNRERNTLQSTEFSFSRFLVPFLSNFSGWSVFMDCDMVARADFAELLALRDEKKSVMVCKHDYVPKEEVKFLGQIQTKYEKKNWSSLILFNNAKCRTLTADYVNTASGLELHQFKWLENDNHIGELPLEWNWLVGEYPFSDAAKVVHYTKGGPYFNQYRDCDYAADWMSNRDAMLTVAQMN
jgi:hypothetical protein